MSEDDAQKLMIKTSFKSIKTIESIYTGGKVDLTADEKLLVSTLNEDIIVTETETGRQVHTLEGDTEMVTSLAVKPNGQHVVSASRSLSLRVWDLATGTCLRTMNKAHDAPVIVMTIDPTSTLVATGSADASIKIWDIDKGYCTHNLRGHGGVISAVKFHKFNNKWYLASGADDCTVRVWDLQSRQCIAVLKSHVSVVRGLDFSSDGRTLISGSRDKVVNVWDWQTKKLKATYPIYETLETVGFVAKDTDFSAYGGKPSSDVFYTGGDKGVIRLWELATGKLVQEQATETNSKHTISDIIYSAASQTLIAVTNDQNILFYSIPQQLKRIKQVVGYNDEIVDIVYLGENETHLAAATNSEQLRVYDVETQNCDIVYGHKDMILCLDRSKDGDVLVTGSKDKTARIWKINLEAKESSDRYTCVGTCIGHTESIGAIAFARKSNNFMITGGQDRTIKYWNLRDIKFDQTDSQQQEQQPHALYTHQAHEKDINTISIAPNDRLFATGSQDKLAKVWNVDTGDLIGTCKGHKRGVWCVRFSNVEQVLATSSGDKTIKIWSLKEFTCLRTFEGHSNSVLRVDFLTAGLQLVSGGSDGLVKLWTIKTNECVGTLDNHTEKVWALAIRKDEKMITSAGADSVINFWEDVTLEEQENELREKEEFIIKEQELQTYMRKKDYLNAILLAMSLNQPFRLLGLFREVMESRSDEESITGSLAVDKILAEMGPDHLEKLLKYIRDWNTNAKHSNVAQTVLYAILSSHNSEELVELTNAKELIEGLLPYTDRHYQRIDDLITQSYIIDYTLQAQE
ncbi:WD40-repeat-containing domain protein [Halteromyces radiatus]|uniref:WD40-repeat-containing domain protein n=1 Tax=Halteromyces radiatus TaxID=101107 RepID=UPI00221FF9E7|nr:WD40-repeat-containing domain protein [Halteromyces radiatus]KAI8079765.1 WD40-repeat-containing domain protein [Halteromyces radiatus]